MSRKLAALFFLIILGSSTLLSGAPLTDSAMRTNVCPMKCCKKKSASNQRKTQNTEKLCRTLNCTTSFPISQTNARVQFVSLLVILKNTSFLQLLSISHLKTKQSYLVKRDFPQLKSFQPKYIQNLSLLI